VILVKTTFVVSVSSFTAAEINLSLSAVALLLLLLDVLAVALLLLLFDVFEMDNSLRRLLLIAVSLEASRSP
jgi:hypothetical protein